MIHIFVAACYGARIQTRTTVIMRPTKSFLVEYKRGSRKTSGPSTVQPPDIASEFAAPAARKLVTMSQRTASAVFQKADETCPSTELAPVARRILPVIVVERDVKPEAEPAQNTFVDAGASPIIEAKVSRRRAKPKSEPDISERLEISAGLAEAPEAIDVPAAPAAPKLARRRLIRLREAEDNLPRGQRWKRRLPKFMR